MNGPKSWGQVKGFPIENLRSLLRSNNQEALGVGAYLIYELGAMVRELIDDIVPLLAHEDPTVRANSIIALEECATKFDGEALGKIILLLDDPEPFVHRIVMRFIQSCERSMLDAGVLTAAEFRPNTIFAELPCYLTKTVFNLRHRIPLSAEAVKTLLSHSNPVANRFGVGLATRPRLIVDKTFIDLAEKIEDEECRNILEWSRERPSPTYAEVMKL